MRTLVKKVLIALFRILPMRGDIIMESHPDFSDNALALYEYFLKQGVHKKRRIHWALHDKSAVIPKLPQGVDAFYLDASGWKQMWKRFSALYRSRYIIDSNSYIYKRRKGQIRLHLGHGMLIKVTPEYHNAERIGDIDGFLVTSPFWYSVFEEKVGLQREVLLSLGYPRNDVLTMSAKMQDDTKYIVWMPTYRQHKKDNGRTLRHRYPYGMPEIMEENQLKKLDAFLGENNHKLYFRPHPAQDLSLLKNDKTEHILVADDAFLKKKGITLYEMLVNATALITDYSSVYFDFLLTEKPIGLTIGDRQEYFENYGCAFSDITKELTGTMIESYEELFDFVRDVVQGDLVISEEYREMKDKCHQVQDGTSSEKIYEHLKEKYDF